MSENLKVNANSTVLEHKRKHNLLVEKLGANENGEFALFENITDKDSHKRFIDNSGTPNTISKFTSAYCRWSLCGSHLMLVLAGTCANGCEIPSYANLCEFVNIPEWILNKIYTVWGGAYIESKVLDFYADDWTHQTMGIALVKSEGKLLFNSVTGSAITFAKDMSFRIAFDLLIDDE